MTATNDPDESFRVTSNCWPVVMPPPLIVVEDAYEPVDDWRWHMICHTPLCETSQPFDKFGRRMSVQWGRHTQSVLDATSHHVLNRVSDGTVAAHVASWPDYRKKRAAANLEDERERLAALMALIDIALTELT